MTKISITVKLAAICIGCIMCAVILMMICNMRTSTDTVSRMSSQPTIEQLVAQTRIPPESPDRVSRRPAVDLLIERGIDVIPYIQILLISDDFGDRLRGQRILEGVSAAHFGFHPVYHWPTNAAENSYRELWEQNGDYDADAERDSRNQSADCWQMWYNKVKK